MAQFTERLPQVPDEIKLSVPVLTFCMVSVTKSGQSNLRTAALSFRARFAAIVAAQDGHHLREHFVSASWRRWQLRQMSWNDRPHVRSVAASFRSPSSSSRSTS